MLGGWPAYDTHGNPERAFNVRLQEAGYTHRLRRQVPQRVRVVAGPRAAAGRAGLDDLQHRLRLGLRRLGLRQHVRRRPAAAAGPAPRTAGEREQRRARTRPTPATVIGDLAMDFLTAGEAADAPYFLEVALYAPHNRTNPEGHYPGDPLFPPMFRDRTGERSCGRVACGKLTVDDLPGFGDTARDNRPRTGQRRAARAWNTGPHRCPRRRRSATCATARGWRSRPTGWSARSSARSARTPTSCSPPTTASTSARTGMGRGKGTPYDTDVRVPLLVTGPGVVPGKRQEVTSNIDLAPTFEELAGLRAGALPQRRSRSCRRSRSPKLVRQSLRLPRAHPADADGRRPGRGVQRRGARPDPVLHRGAQPARRCWCASTSTRAAARRRGATSTTATARPLREAQHLRQHEAASPRSTLLMAKLAAFDACRENGDEPVSDACRVVRSSAQ